MGFRVFYYLQNKCTARCARQTSEATLRPTALTPLVLLMLAMVGPWACGDGVASDPGGAPACQEGERQPGDTPCGLNGRGRLDQRCGGGVRTDDPEACVDSDVCVDGEEQGGDTPCGLNGRGLLGQRCVEGAWADDAEACADPDVCADGAQQAGETSCGLNGRGLLGQRCVEGAWADDAEACADPDVCSDGAQQAGESPCGLNGRGVLGQQCAEGAWIDDAEACVDPDVCTDGAEQAGATACGLNGRGLLGQRCVEGAWVDDAEQCADPDVCTDGAEQVGATPCGLNGRGLLGQQCVEGAWNDDAEACVDPDVCTDGSEQAGATPCGLNGRGLLGQQCVEGAWSDVAEACVDPDVCTDGAEQAGATPCGLNGRGLLGQQCVEGAWSDVAEACADPDVCTDGAEQAGATPCGLNGRGLLGQRCVDGTWVDRDGEPEGCADPDECLDGAEEQAPCGWTGEGRRVRACAEGRWEAGSCEDVVRWRMLKDVNPGPAFSFPRAEEMLVLGEQVCLFLSDGEHGREPWLTDLSEEGTALAVDASHVREGEWGAPGGFTDVYAWRDRFFGAAHDSRGWEPWTTDCTPEGTFRLGDFSGGPSDSVPRFFNGFGDVVVFHTRGDGWARSDGTVEGTFNLEGIPRANEKVRVGDQVFFVENPPGMGDRELWRTDMTAEGTWRLVDAVPGEESDDYELLTPWGESHLLFFTVGALWVSDGTPEGTLIVDQGGVSRYHRPLPAADRFYFQVVTAEGQLQLRTSEGSPETTLALLDQAWPPQFQAPSAAVGHDGRVYVWHLTAEHGYEPWVSDGTAAGTGLLADLYPDRETVVVSGSRVTPFQGRTCFWVARSVDLETTVRDLWCSDGTAAGTELVLRDLSADFLLFYEDLGGPLTGQGYLTLDHDRVYRSDGTAAGTWLVTELFPGEGGQVRLDGVALGERWLFSANDWEHGMEPWVLERIEP